MDENKVSLARIYYPVKVLGPGNRVGIWLNGCSRHCPGCISPEMQPYDESREILCTDIAELIKKIKDPIDGFTISGGEPFYAPESLCTLVRLLAELNDDILIYTGYTLDELKASGSKAIDDVLEMCAAVIDGPYIRELNDNKGLRGSSNQRIRVFRHPEKYDHPALSERKLQMIKCGDRILTIGIPKETEDHDQSGSHAGTDFRVSSAD